MKLHAGDVVMAEFFKDKIRPGVVVGDAAYRHITVIVCPMTSDLIASPVRVRIAPNGSGLKGPSEIMPYRLQAMPPHRIRRVLGRLTAAELARLEDILLEVFGLQGACQRALGW